MNYSQPGDPVVGIIGGMGPAATADFMRKLVCATPAARDQDHLPVVVWNDPTVPDRTSALLEQGADPTPWIEHAARKLVGLGCSVIAMPCNTAHAFSGGIADCTAFDFVDMLATTVDTVAALAPMPHRVGVLATDGTVRSGLYSKAFTRKGIEVIYPRQDGQAELMRNIARVKSATYGDADRLSVRRIAGTLQDEGASVVVLGCTELPILFRADTGTPVLDPTTLLAQEVVAQARAHQTLREGHGRDCTDGVHARVAQR